jgi:ArsR family transcriptional regulator
MGCGPGLLLRDLASRYDAAELVGVDIQPSMLETARETAATIGERARIVTADISRPPISDLSAGAFDAVVISMVLHEMNLPAAGLAEAARVLAQGGRIVLVDWARYPLRRYSEGALTGGEDQILHFAEHCRYDPEDYLFLAETAGLVPDEVLTRKRGARIVAVLRRA